MSDRLGFASRRSHRWHCHGGGARDPRIAQHPGQYFVCRSEGCIHDLRPSNPPAKKEASACTSGEALPGCADGSGRQQRVHRLVLRDRLSLRGSFDSFFRLSSTRRRRSHDSGSPRSRRNVRRRAWVQYSVSSGRGRKWSCVTRDAEVESPEPGYKRRVMLAHRAATVVDGFESRASLSISIIKLSEI